MDLEYLTNAGFTFRRGLNLIEDDRLGVELAVRISDHLKNVDGATQVVLMRQSLIVNPSTTFAGGLPCRSHWWPGSECDRKRGDGKPDLEDFRMCIVVFWSYKLPTNVEIMARQIQGSPIVLCFNRWRWDGDRGQVKRDPTLLSNLSTNLMRVLLCQCTRRGKRLNHFYRTQVRS